jgi:N-formylglutamate amidohydrolase
MPIEERQSIAHELTPPFDVLRPAEQMSPFIFCSPHSGRIYPSRFLAQSRLDALSLRKSEDAYVDQLFANVVELGAPLIAARFPRAYLDVNREPYEFDPELIEDRLPDFANTQSVRVVGGLGTVARIVADGEEIYRQRLALSEVMVRVEQLYRPFHAALAELVNETRMKFGYAILVDCHSMPSATLPNSSGPRPDFVLGDRFGASCDTRLTRTIKDLLAALGYDVQLNRPYAGGFITEHYGRPRHGVHALQIEINRGLYLNEVDVEPSKAMSGLRAELTSMAERLFNIVPGVLERRAAE